MDNYKLVNNYNNLKNKNQAIINDFLIENLMNFKIIIDLINEK